MTAWYEKNSIAARAYSAAYYKRNSVRIAARKRSHYRNNRDKARAYDLKHRYNLSIEEYIAILESQGGVCPGCGAEDPNQVDHDHSCCSGEKSCGKCVRGILCHRCNKGLGLLRDSPEVLNALAGYVVRKRG